MTNNLVYLFANHWAPLVVGRNAGLMAMELFTLRAMRWRSGPWAGLRDKYNL